MSSPAPKIFLSYARKDGEAFATALRKRLQHELPELPSGRTHPVDGESSPNRVDYSALFFDSP